MRAPLLQPGSTEDLLGTYLTPNSYTWQGEMKASLHPSWLSKSLRVGWGDRTQSEKNNSRLQYVTSAK